MSSKVVVAVVATAALLLAGCAGGSTPKVDGLRTDPDGQGLVASYTGGSCDGPAQLKVNETATRIDVSVVVKPVLGVGGACDSAGHPRTVTARLEQPVGTRSIWFLGRRQVPFDGARLLLIPAAVLPPDLTRTAESGGLADQTSQQGDAVTSDWHTTYLRVASASTTSTCTPGNGYLDIHTGPAADLTSGWTAVSTAAIGTAEAQLYRSGTSRNPDGWAYTWKTDRDSVAIANLNVCRGDHLFGAAELLRLARALKSP